MRFFQFDCSKIIIQFSYIIYTLHSSLDYHSFHDFLFVIINIIVIDIFNDTAISEFA